MTVETLSARSNGLGHNKKPAPTLDLVTFINDKVTVEPEDREDPYRGMFLQSIMDQDKEYPDPESLITIIQGDEPIPFLTLKSFSLWQGKAKSKKTTMLALAIAAFIRPTPLSDSIRFECASPGKVLFFDTEQGESYAAKTMKLILKLAELTTSTNLIYCDLREFSPTDRIRIIEAGVTYTPGAKLLVIDGVVDLLTDFMDPGEGHMTITNLVRLCSVHNIHIAGVLHQNKNDKNARAHVGTISSQKCEIEISTEVDTNDRSQSIVSCINSRGLPFEPFAIRWDKGSLPCVVQGWTTGAVADEKAAQKMIAVKDVAKSVFKPFAPLRNKEAIEGLMNATSKSESAAKRYLKDLMGWGFVTKGNTDGLYRINTELGSRVHEGSNEGS